MAINYQQAGLTIPVTNSTHEVIKSVAPVVLGDLIAVVITDIVKDIAKRHYFDNSQLYFFAAYHGISCNRF